jgi:cobalt-zinc-cadmium efflux system membrane fusion protein
MTINRRIIAGCTIAALAAVIGCGDDAETTTKPAAPATVANPVSESSLSTISLTEDAEKRLAIALAAVSVEGVFKTRSVAGEVIVPPGRTVTVSAPMAGTVQATTVPRGGLRVTREQTVFTLMPLQPGERDQQIDAEREAASAAAELLAAEQRLVRLEGLLKEGATSQRAVEEARAQQQVLAASVKAARARLDASRKGGVGPRGEVEVKSPLTGILQDVTAAPGQAVSSGSALFTVAQVDALWIKVSLYVGDRGAVDLTQPVAVVELGGASPIVMASRVAGPPTADPRTSSTDLFFAPERPSDRLRVGDRVSVQLPLRESEQGLVVPTSAIVYDVHGGTWVYEALGNHKYARRRVEVKTHVGDKAVLERGLAAGTNVVTDGAAELFGTEFGAGK